MQRNLLTSLVLYEAIRTTKKRAEVVRPQLDQLITTARTKVPHVAIRSINRVVMHKNASRKLMEVLKQRYSARTSGFTRMIPLGARRGDGAEMVTLELVDRDMAVVAVEPAAEKKPKKTKKESTTSDSSSQA